MDILDTNKRQRSLIKFLSHAICDNKEKEMLLKRIEETTRTDFIITLLESKNIELNNEIIKIQEHCKEFDRHARDLEEKIEEKEKEKDDLFHQLQIKQSSISSNSNIYEPFLSLSKSKYSTSDYHKKILEKDKQIEMLEKELLKENQRLESLKEENNVLRKELLELTN